jgi:hypothetical protein
MFFVRLNGNVLIFAALQRKQHAQNRAFTFELKPLAGLIPEVIVTRQIRNLPRKITSKFV